MIQLYKVSSELLLPPLVAPAARSSLHSISKTDCLGLWRVYSTGRWAKKKEKMLKVPLLLWLRSRTGLLKLPARTSTALLNEHIIIFPKNAGWHGNRGGSPNRLNQLLPHQCKHTKDWATKHENEVVSRESFALLCPVWATSDSSSTPICNDQNENIYSTERKKHTFSFTFFSFLGETGILSFHICRKKRTQIEYLSHMPP